MDNDFIKKALMSMRGNPGPGLATAGQPSAPIAATPPGMDQAYGNPMNPVQSAQPSPVAPSMMNFNPALEQQGQAAGNAPMNPMIQAIMKHFGMLNMMRNRANQTMVDPSMQG